MGIEYKTDPDLEFLQYCSDDDLSVLARYMAHDKDGKDRATSELTFKDGKIGTIHESKANVEPWKLLAGELQHFGGDTFVNVFRGSGVFYKEILCDVCSVLKLKFDKNLSAYEIEDALIAKLLEESMAKLTKEQREELQTQIGDINKLEPNKIHSTLQRASSYYAATLIANAAFAQFAGSGGAVAVIGSMIPRAVLLTTPVGIALSVLLAVPSLSGASYKVTIPCVVQIAYMRRAFEEKNTN